jgi:hypothetical protein
MVSRQAPERKEKFHIFSISFFDAQPAGAIGAAAHEKGAHHCAPAAFSGALAGQGANQPLFASVRGRT